MKNIEAIVDFFFETGILAKTPRTGFFFLGGGKQSVAEHTNRTVFIGYTLAMIDGEASVSQVIKMCLFHDLIEARTSDLNYVHQRYTTVDEKKAVSDLTARLPFGKDIRELLEEYEKRKSHEAILAKDADNLEFMLSLKEEADTGNARAKEWLPLVAQRLKSDIAIALAKKIMSTDSSQWWYTGKDDPWWVNRKKEEK